MKYTINRNYRDYIDEEETLPVKKSILLKKGKSRLSRILSRLNPFKK
jgi:hypothetical protein